MAASEPEPPITTREEREYKLTIHCSAAIKSIAELAIKAIHSYNTPPEFKTTKEEE
jgi:hypothetical protein